MIDERRILYAIITDWQTGERIRRDDDPLFDAWEHLAKKIGHKNPSTLRKMCEPRGSDNGAKLGYREAMIIMAETNDYRLLHYMKKELQRMKKEKDLQISFFDEPLRSLEDIA